MGRKPARPRFKYTREFINKDGKPDTYIERRGLRELKIPVSKQARGKLPRVQEQAQLLSIVASKILKEAGERSLVEVIEGVKQRKGVDRDAAIKDAIAMWDYDIMRRYGIISPVTHAADFLGGMYLIARLFAVRSARKRAYSPLPATTRHLLQVLAFADAWHWLHMEVHDEHRLALGGAQLAKNLGAAAPARTEKKKERVEFVRQACVAYWSKHGRRNAAHTASRLYSQVNGTLKAKGHQTYTLDSFVKLVREIFGESAGKSESSST
jgi:hypothetical protein